MGVYALTAQTVMMVFGEYLKKPKGTRQKAKKRHKALVS